MRVDLSALRARMTRLLPQRRPSPWTVADLQPGQLRAITIGAARSGERIPVLHAASLSLAEALPDAAALSSFAQQMQATKKRWALLLPRDEYRLSVMPEPDLPADELVHSVRWQLATTLDFPVEEAAVDLMKIPTQAWQPERAPELYVVAARGDTVRAQAALFRSAGLELRVIDIRETAQRNIGARLERDGELLMLVACCDDEVRISVNWQRELYMDRLIAEPAVHDEQPERRAAAAERIQLQVLRSLDAVRSSYPFMSSTRIVVAGAPEGFCDRLRTVQFDPVEELHPEALFDLSQVPELREPRVFMRHFHALGAALREQEAAA